MKKSTAILVIVLLLICMVALTGCNDAAGVTKEPDDRVSPVPVGGRFGENCQLYELRSNMWVAPILARFVVCGNGRSVAKL